MKSVKRELSKKYIIKLSFEFEQKSYSIKSKKQYILIYTHTYVL
jgi:hypothetical protein